MLEWSQCFSSVSYDMLQTAPPHVQAVDLLALQLQNKQPAHSQQHLARSILVKDMHSKNKQANINVANYAVS